MDRVYILAANAAEADLWRRQQQWGPSMVRYISDEHSLRGLSKPRLAILPGFWTRKDAFEIWNYLAYSRPVDWQTGKPISDRFFQNAKNFNAHVKEPEVRPIEVHPERPTKSTRRFKTIKPRHDLRASF